MNDSETSKKLDRITQLLTANLLVMAVGIAILIMGLLPKVERAVQSTERVEQRLQKFAETVDPVVVEAAEKTIQSIIGIDAAHISDTATKETNALIKALGDKAKTYIKDLDKKEESKQPATTIKNEDTDKPSSGGSDPTPSCAP